MNFGFPMLKNLLKLLQIYLWLPPLCQNCNLCLESKIFSILICTFLDFRGFDFRNFWFTAVYNSILFSSSLVLLSNLDLRGFCFWVKNWSFCKLLSFWLFIFGSFFSRERKFERIERKFWSTKSQPRSPLSCADKVRNDG